MVELGARRLLLVVQNQACKAVQVLNSVRLPSFRGHNTTIKPRNCFLIWGILVLELFSKLAQTYNDSERQQPR